MFLKIYIAMMKMVSVMKYVIWMKCKNHGMLFGNINVHNIISIMTVTEHTGKVIDD